MFDTDKFVDDLHEYLARALAPLAQRIKALEESKPDMRPIIAEEVAKAVA